MNADAIRQALRVRYPAREYALFDELRNGVGHRANRSADVVAMSLWPSRGLDVHGFEIKVDRRDLMRELKTPAKADDVAKYCDYWWLVVGDAKLFSGLTLPRTWGVLVLDGEKLVEHRPASKMKSKALDRHMVAAILRKTQATTERRLAEYVPRESMAAEIERLVAIETGRFARDLERYREVATERNLRVERADEVLRTLGVNVHAPSEKLRAIAALANVLAPPDWRHAPASRALTNAIDLLSGALLQLQGAQELVDALGRVGSAHHAEAMEQVHADGAGDEARAHGPERPPVA